MISKNAFSKKSKYVISFLLIFSVFIVLLLTIESYADKTKTTIQILIIENAQSHFEQLKNIRHWNAKHGGVYVLSKDLQPNPYLKNNTLKDHLNRELIKINPAWMTRQLSEIAKNRGVSYKIFSDTPLNPKNTLPSLYRTSYSQIDANNLEAYRFNSNNKTFEFVGGLLTKQSCLKCHDQQGYKVGDVRGAIGITLEIKDYYLILEKIDTNRMVFHIINLLLMIITVYFIHYWFSSQSKLKKINKKLHKRVIKQTKKISDANVMLNNVIEGSQLGYWDWNLNTKEHFVNDRWLEILGLDRSDIKNHESDWADRIYKKDQERIEPTILEAIEKKEPYTVEFRMQHKEGHYVWIQGSGGVVEFDKKGQPKRLSGTHIDISERKALEFEKKRQSKVLEKLFKESPNLIVFTDGNEIIDVNNRFYELFPNYSSLEQFKHEHQCICDLFIFKEEESCIHPSLGNWVDQALNNSQNYAIMKVGDKENYYRVYANSLVIEERVNYVISFTDITEEHCLKERLIELATIDELTEVYNRRHFNKVSPKELNRSKRHEELFVLMIADIDHFKQYNDHYGHQEGDKALKKVAQQIQKELKRASDYVFRLGGEEFGIITSQKSINDIKQFAEHLRSSVESLNIEHKHNGDKGCITVSIGVTIEDFSKKSDIGIDQLYVIADRALYKAKESGRDQVVISH
jgi:diguanylate cyclase (GGDEF)-like protein/PAS domain S-box-containing protein